MAVLAASGPGLPFLIGVRHHAPSLAAALPALLDAAAPDVLLVELPAEFQPWLGWLAHEETEAPVALAAVPAYGAGPGPGPAGEQGPAFYPFADFSPELVALRWAARNGVPAVACDLPLADRAWAGGGPDAPPAPDSAPGPGQGQGLSAALRSRLTGRDGEDLWDRLVEARAPGSTPEALRRAALLTGWALRREAEAGGGVDGTDLVRETCMRGHLAEALANGRRPAVVVGAFHAPALLLSATGSGEVSGPDAPGVPGASDASGPGTPERASEPGPPESGADGLEASAPRSSAPHAPEPRSSQPDASGPGPSQPDAPEPGASEPRPPVPGPSEPGADGLRATAPDAPVPGPSASHASGPGTGSHVNGAAEAPACTVSLVPYTYPLLDSRSGYPAGIRDPEWQHTVLEAAGDPAALHEALVRTAVRVCAALREQGHPYGPADGREVVRVAGDLARLRDLPAAGRGEFLEAVQTVLGRGETYGTGRAVARALDHVLVGARTGRPTRAAPRSGLGPAVEAEAAALSLPGPGDAHERTPRDLRLDPARSALDRRRELLLRRLTVCGIAYAQEQEVTGAAGTEGLTTRWQVRWTPATAATLTAAGARGVTAAQAAEGVLRQRHTAERAEGGPTAAQVIRGLTEAAGCGLPALTDERLTEVAAVLPASGTLPELLAGLDLLDRLDAGHLPGLAVPDDPSAPDTAAAARAARTARAVELLTSAAVRQVDGLTGSEKPEDARALLELSQRADRVGGIRLTDALARLAADGTPLIAAAAGAVRVLTGHEEAGVFGARVASWVDGAVHSDSRAALAARLTGVLTVAGPLLTVGIGALDPLLHRVVELDDAAFLTRLPALRGGFDTLSPAARERLLDTVEERLGERVDTLGADDPAELARRTAADLAARELLAALGLPVPPPAHDGPFTPPSDHPATATATGTVPTTATVPSTEIAPATTPATASGNAPAPAGTPATGTADATATASASGNAPAPARTLAPADRWRLVLGRRPEQLPPAATRLATALDELYGAGHGEGSRSGLPGDGHGGGSGPRGGREPSYPGVREWSEELAALFGPGIREEVLAAAAAAGRQDVLAALDPAAATPSVELLRTILRYAGGLPEARIAALRPLVRRLVDELTRQLATRLRPALTGTMSPRPTRRPGGRLDLPRTLRANLATARRTADGTVRVIPEKPVFRGRVRRSADWRLILVTDVSGSMEASTIWSALTASVLAGVPALSTHFLAFSTEVVDLTGHVHDPLSLLLEVSVGGGTHIAAGLRHARSLVAVPARTLVVVISDFEEGAPLGGLLAEVRALVNTGCHVLGCASLDDAGRPRYSTGVAGQLVAAGMPVAALSPLELARWIGEKTA
ncbi:DUF5682 family protein [Streptomyces sp. NPDC021020]|uniref:DUF5682 family protein n=1 Tax=Streptomyces sp. NPDC021020 TaxID=3365109 RepID=UPI00379057D8